MHDAAASLSPGAIRAFRDSATLVSVAPRVRIRVRDRQRLLVEVRRPPFPAASPHLLVTPCAYRNAVGRAYGLVQQGEKVAFAGLPATVEPAIEVGLAPGDACLAGGIYRLAHHEHWTHVFATDLDVDDATEAVSADDGPWAGRRWGETVGFHHDELTGITLVHTTGPAGDTDRADLQVEVLETALGRCLTAELLGGLSPSPT